MARCRFAQIRRPMGGRARGERTAFSVFGLQLSLDRNFVVPIRQRSKSELRIGQHIVAALSMADLRVCCGLSDHARPWLQSVELAHGIWPAERSINNPLISQSPTLRERSQAPHVSAAEFGDRRSMTRTSLRSPAAVYHKNPDRVAIEFFCGSDIRRGARLLRAAALAPGPAAAAEGLERRYTIELMGSDAYTPGIVVADDGVSAIRARRSSCVSWWRKSLRSPRRARCARLCSRRRGRKRHW
jgi:hypothetical protein